jgi:hypothetical protein
MSVNRTVVIIAERNANLILNTIRNNPNLTENELRDMLKEKEPVIDLERTMFRRYLTVLHEKGHIKKSITCPHKYKSHNDTPFTYTPVSLNKKKRNIRGITNETT